TPTITSASPAFWSLGATTYLFMGTTGNILKFNATSQVIDSTNTNPGSASVYGRIVVTGVNTLFAGDDGGTMWSLSPINFAGTATNWSYVVSGDSIKSSAYYDFSSTTLHFGTEGGKVVVLNSSGTALTGYPYVPGTASDPIRSSVLYFGGILAV